MRLCSILPCLLVLCGCATPPPVASIPSCGDSVSQKSVVVVEAEELFAAEGVDTVLEYARETVGEFRLTSNQTLRADGWPKRSASRKWYDSQKEAAKLGCDVLIVVKSEVRDSPYGRVRQYLLLAGRREGV